MSLNNNDRNVYFGEANGEQQLWASAAQPPSSANSSVSRSISLPIQEEVTSSHLVQQQEHSTSINMEGNEFGDRFENTETVSPRRTRNVEVIMEQYARALRDHFNTRTSFRNLNNVLSPEIIRTFSHPAASSRYSVLTDSIGEVYNDNHTMSNSHEDARTRRGSTPPISPQPVPMNTGFRFNMSRSNDSHHLVHSESGIATDNNTLTNDESIANRNQPINNETVPIDPQVPEHNRTNGTANNADFDNNVFPDILLTTLRHCLQYVPFVCILFIKFIYDHLVGIVDVVILQGIMYFVNRSLQAQVAKFAQKQNRVLLRNLFAIVCVIISRFLFASAQPDPFGLLITPPPSERTITHQVSFNHHKGATTTSSPKSILASTVSPQIPLETTVIIPKLISLESIIYYTAVNDLVLKLITISIKTLITLVPVGAIRYKARARLYVFLEYVSQFYRALAPIRQWMLFLFESYSGFHAISGVLFSSIYIVLKGCEISERGKSLKKAFINLIRNMDYARKPTKDEMDAADALCPICHDNYNLPVILECSHIFCDGCVTTWFKREQTCPMCRAKVSEDPTWQDGSTTFFYQLY